MNHIEKSIPAIDPGRKSGRRFAFAFLLPALLLASGLCATAADLRPAQHPVMPPVGSQDQTALIELDGTGSESPDGGELSYQWRQLDGPKVELSDPTAPKPYFRTGKAGYYRFELIVTANGMRSEPFFVELEIERQNLPPVAVVPPEIHGEVGKPLEIDGGESYDPEGQPITYRWRSLTRGLELPLAAITKPVLSFDPVLDGVFEVELVVSDGETVSPPVVTRLAVKPKPRPPIAKGTVVALKIPTAPTPQTMAPPTGSRPIARIEGPTVAQLGEKIMLDARGSRGSSGTRLEYLWRQKSGPFISDFEVVFDGAAERFQPSRDGDYEFELVVSDGAMESDPVMHKVRIVKEPDPPVAVVVAPARARPGALVKMDATQSYDLEGSPLVYRWRQTGGPRVTNYVIDDKIGDAAPAFHPPTAGVYSFELVVSNGRMQSKPIEIDIEVGDARRPPSLAITGPEVVNTGDRLEWSANSDQQGLAFVWRQVEGPAQILSQTNGPRVAMAPPLPGRYVMDLSALDSDGRVVASARRSLEVFGMPAEQQAAPAPPTPAATARPLPLPAPTHPTTPTAEPQLSPLLDMPPTPVSPIPPLAPVAPRTPEPMRSGRPAAQIHPSSISNGLYDYNGSSALDPLAPLAPIP